MHPLLNFPLEADAYWKVLIAYNLALGSCLGRTIARAEDYDEACRLLARRDWPANARAVALTYRGQFPELEELFAVTDPKVPLPKVTVWNQAQEDLLRHDAYQRMARRQSRPYRQLLRQSGMQMKDVYQECLPRVTSYVIGKAATWETTLTPYRERHPDTTWLQWALNGSKKEVTRAVRHHLGLTVRDQSAQPPPRPGLGADPTVAAPSRELPPEAEAQARHLERVVDEAIRQLPEPDRQLFDLCEGRSFDEVDREMHWSVGTAKRHHDRIWKNILKRLGDSNW